MFAVGRRVRLQLVGRCGDGGSGGAVSAGLHPADVCHTKKAGNTTPVAARMPEHKGWEQFDARRHPDGGYQLLSIIWWDRKRNVSSNSQSLETRLVQLRGGILCKSKLI